LKETFSEKMARERHELAEALRAVIDFHNALDYFHSAAYKGDALRDLEAKRGRWKELQGKIYPYLKE